MNVTRFVSSIVRGYSKSNGIEESESSESKWINAITLADGREGARVELLGISKDNYVERLESLKILLYNTSAPLRLDTGIDHLDNKVLYLRERTWGEFFEENIMGQFWPHQLAEMKRDTAFMIENKFSEVIAHIRENMASQRQSIGISVGDANELLFNLRYRVWIAETDHKPLGRSSGSMRISGNHSNSSLTGRVSYGVKHVSPIGCSVVQAHPLSFGANNIIFPRTEIRGMRTFDDRVLEQSRDAALKAEQEYEEQTREWEKNAEVKRSKRGAEELQSDQGTENSKQVHSAQFRLGGVPFPQSVRSIRHTPNLLLANCPAEWTKKCTSEQDWYNYYSALLNTSLKNSLPPGTPSPGSLKGTVVIGPQPDLEERQFSEANLRGLVRACRERSDVEFSRREQTNLLAITIAHTDATICNAIKDFLAAATQKSKTYSKGSDENVDLEAKDENSCKSSIVGGSLPEMQRLKKEAHVAADIPPHKRYPNIFVEPMSDDDDDADADADEGSRVRPSAEE